MSSSLDFFLRQIRKIDYFKYQQAPKHVGGPSKTAIGGLGTLLLIAIMVAYISVSATTWYQAPPDQSVLQFPLIAQNMTFVPTCIHLPFINNPQYFTYTLERQFRNALGNKNGTFPLNLTHPSDDIVCLVDGDSSAYIESFCNPGLCTIIKFKLFVCVNGTGDNNATQCMTQAQIASILEQNYVVFNYTTNQGTVLFNTPPKITYSAKYITWFSYNEVVSQPDYLKSFRVSSEAFLSYLSSEFAIQYFFYPNWPYQEVLEVSMQMSSIVVETKQQKQTVLDLIGSWGAFFGVIAGALSLIFLRHNENVFFKKAPLWGHITDHFMVDRAAEDENSKIIIPLESAELRSSTNYKSL